MTAYKKWALVPMVSAMLVACGGDSSQDGGNAPATGTEGRVTLAGGLANATIFVDLNDSSSHDEDEPIGYTDSQGFFGGGKGYARQHLLGSRVDHIAPLAGFGLDPLTVDQQLDLLDFGLAGREGCVHEGFSWIYC